ncbi:MAG: substrate-binding domain-containing protein [Chloroflexota bacterium]
MDFLAKTADDPAYGLVEAAVLANLVSSEQNVRAVLTKVALGEADAGIVYSSDLASEDGSKVGRIDIPDALNTIATYPIAPLNDSENAETVQALFGTSYRDRAGHSGELRFLLVNAS